MSEEVELHENETVIAVLVEPDEYIRHRNHVAIVTNERLVFLKKKTLGAYFDVEYIPVSECTQIDCGSTLAIGSMIAGGLLACVGLLVFIFAMTGKLTNIGAVIYGVPLIGVGAVLFFGVRRRIVRFHCRSGLLKWVSSAGRYKKKLKDIQLLREFARSRGIVLKNFECNV